MGIIINGQNDTIGPVDNSMSLLGTVSIGGTMTIEDFTNIDSVGLITARNGLHVTGGNVGINETSPQQQLHVHDDTDYHGIFVNGNAAPRVNFARNTTTTAEWSVGLDGTNGNNFAIAQAGNTAKLIIDTSGKIGINDSTPDITLSIKGLGSFDADSNSFYFGANFTGTGQNYIGSSKHAQRFFLNNASANGYFSYSNTGSAGNAGDAITWQERLRITSAGKIGINEATPDAQLHVRGSGNSSGLTFLSEDSSGNNTFWIQDGGKVGVHYYPFAINRDSTDTIPSSTYFYVHSASPFAIKNDGAVVIGTDTAATNTELTIRATSPHLSLYATPGQDSRLNMGDTDDHDIGMIAYANSDNSMRFTTNATERLRITDAGMVGINMTPSTTGNSTYMLQMYNAGTQCFMSLGQGSGNGPLNGLVMGVSNAAHYITGRENSPMIFATNDTERVRISSAGDATLKYKVSIGESYAGGEVLQVGKSSGTSYMAFRNGGSNMGFIGYADQLISGGASNELGIRCQDDIRFATGGNTERFRISDSVITCATGVGMAIDGGTSQQATDSTLLVTKQNNNDWAFQVRNYEGTSTDYGFYSRSKNNASYAIGVYDADNSSWRFRVNGGGTIYATNTTVSSISDQRLKENIVDANSQWDDIKALRFRNFNWREDSGFSDGRTYLGLIAQEVEPISPNLVDINAQSKEDIENEVPDPEYKNVKYSIVWMKAVKALQEAQTRIETLETQLTDALARITALEG